MFKFSRIYIEISNICNLQCSFCPEVLRPKQIMSVDQFKIIVKKVANHTDQICLHLMGEPLLHPHLGEILSLASHENLQVNLTTNGLLFEKKFDEIVNASSLRQINFSLQSFSDNFPQKSFDDYLEKVINRVDELMEKRSEVYINFRLWDQGTPQENDLKNKVIAHLKQRYQVQINENVDVGFKKSKKVINRLYLHFDSRFDWPNLEGPNFGTKGFCHGLTSHIGIHTNGDVVPCCLDKESKIKLGNILEENSLEDILKNSRSIKIREGFKNRQIIEDLCLHCSYRLRFS